MLWAEQKGLILKGFPIQCSLCGSKQWIPVSGFAPPVVCRGCANEIPTPFGERPVINFKYRVSERLRRLYEHDAMGHLLVMNFLAGVFFGGSMLTGMHPGIEIRLNGKGRVEAETDVLVLTQAAEMIPIEVKRSATGFTAAELEKLDKLARLLDAPWIMLAVCEYGSPDEGFPGLARRGMGTDSGGTRLILSYDVLLDPMPAWGLGADPFAWVPLTDEQRGERERRFVQTLVTRADEGPFDELAMSMLHRPELE